MMIIEESCYLCVKQASRKITPQIRLWGQVWLGLSLMWTLHWALVMPGGVHTCFFVTVQADKNAGLARESALLEGKCQLKAALSSALESKAEVEAALQTARRDQQRLQQEVCATRIFSPYCCGCQSSQQVPSNCAVSRFRKTSTTLHT